VLRRNFDIPRHGLSSIGDTVNTDRLSKYLGTEVLRSEKSVEKVDGLFTRQVGKFMLKGEAQPIVVTNYRAASVR
jgi:hypothetical protein